jgi:hypothetical protein
MLGSPRKAEFLALSLASGIMCLTCPGNKCGYFGMFMSRLFTANYSNLGIVNVDELIKMHSNDVMAVKGTDVGGDSANVSDEGQYESGNFGTKHD